MQIIIEKQELKNALGLYLQENPQLLQLWFKEMMEKLLIQPNLHILSDDQLTIEQFKAKYAVKKTALKKLQVLWADAPSAEQLMLQLHK
jgi:hypothetical protein